MPILHLQFSPNSNFGKEGFNEEISTSFKVVYLIYTVA